MIQIRQLKFTYPGQKTGALEISSLDIADRERVLLKGPSGSGKSTLLNLLAGILRPQEGSIRIQGEEWTQKNDRELRELRGKNIGFVHQDFALLEYLNVNDNILLPYLINPEIKCTAEIRARRSDLMRSLGITDKGTRFPNELSFGERQRAVIARSVITGPSLLLADEPTASLDEDATQRTMDLFQQVLEQCQTTFLMVSHDKALASRFDRTIEMVELNPIAAMARYPEGNPTG